MQTRRISSKGTTNFLRGDLSTRVLQETQNTWSSTCNKSITADSKDKGDIGTSSNQGKTALQSKPLIIPTLSLNQSYYSEEGCNTTNIVLPPLFKKKKMKILQHCLFNINNNNCVIILSWLAYLSIIWSKQL